MVLYMYARACGSHRSIFAAYLYLYPRRQYNKNNFLPAYCVMIICTVTIFRGRKTLLFVYPHPSQPFTEILPRTPSTLHIADRCAALDSVIIWCLQYEPRASYKSTTFPESVRERNGWNQAQILVIKLMMIYINDAQILVSHGLYLPVV